MNVPTDLLELRAWTNRHNHFLEKAEALFTYHRAFFRRNGGYLNDVERDALHNSLLEGSRDDWEAGYLLFGDDDGYRLRPYTCSTNFGTGFPMPSAPHVETCFGRRYRFAEDPGTAAYEAFLHDWGVSESAIPRPSLAFVTSATQSPESLSIFFPLAMSNAYLLVTHGARYGERTYHLFEGDPMEWGKAHRRGRRTLKEALPEVFPVPVPEDIREPRDINRFVNLCLQDGVLYNGYNREAAGVPEAT